LVDDLVVEFACGVGVGATETETMSELKKMGRLALREEGTLWVAYYALPDTMEGALFLGSIRKQFVEDAERKLVFMALMKEAVGDILEEKMGERPTWPEGEQPAPEHERGGNA
jgi:hypothetical protein